MAYLKKIEVKNFRLLEEVSIYLEQQTTVIVGRNNSGKTSLTEIFRRLLLDDKLSYRLEDFSLPTHKNFWDAVELKNSGEEDKKIREILPVIEIKLTIKYEKDNPDLGILGNFIIDLEPDCTEALVVIRYQPKDGMLDDLLELSEVEGSENADSKKKFYRALKTERISKYYEAKVYAEDPNDSTNQKELEFTKVKHLLCGGFISAQRGLDDITNKDVNLLGRILEGLYKSADSDLSNDDDKRIVKDLEQAVEVIQKELDKGFNSQLMNLLPTFEEFGYPGLSDPQIRTETILDAGRLLKNHTKVQYAGINGVNLPETYNGLGTRNLIFILLKMFEFFKEYKAKNSLPCTHMIFIEEPEVHLHPQMQEVFINKINSISKLFSEKFNGGLDWNVQFVITTHSSHLANKASFESMRYFLPVPVETMKNVFTTRVKDLHKGFMQENSSDTDGLAEDKEFLHKYMTLTRCDLLFADKAILIEGTAERLLLPKMIELTEAKNPDMPKLSSQYISVVEVGGYHAHLFFRLLKFLELRTLIITDLDAVNGEKNREACIVTEGTDTSNGCIKAWFSDKNMKPSEIIKIPDSDKINGFRRIAFQIPETDDAPCGRTFEDAFMLANTDKFSLDGTSNPEKEGEVFKKVKSLKKSDFALEYGIDKTDWIVPRYIKDGLIWLAEGEQNITESPMPIQEEVMQVEA